MTGYCNIEQFKTGVRRRADVHTGAKQYKFTQRGESASASTEHLALHILEKVDEDYDPGGSGPQDWDKISAMYRPLIDEYRDIFPKDLPAGLPPDRPHVNHVIPTVEDDGPPKRRGRIRYSLEDMAEIKEHINALRHKQFIQPSSSPWGASITFAPKKNGKLRMCF